jgi:hypothetical protein
MAAFGLRIAFGLIGAGRGFPRHELAMNRSIAEISRRHVKRYVGGLLTRYPHLPTSEQSVLAIASAPVRAAGSVRRLDLRIYFINRRLC